MAEEGDAVGNWWGRGCLGAFGGGGAVSGEALVVTAGGIEVNYGQDAQCEKNWHGWKQKPAWQVIDIATENGIGSHGGCLVQRTKLSWRSIN